MIQNMPINFLTLFKTKNLVLNFENDLNMETTKSYSRRSVSSFSLKGMAS